MTVARFRSLGSRLAQPALLALVLACAVYGAIRQASIPVAQATNNLVVDDAFYYIVPARNLIAGHGYTLDGEVRTNGVQPLWALVTIGLVALADSSELVPHLLVLLSGLCWIAAGMLLYATLARWDGWMGLLAATGWIATGFAGRVAFQGMENGLHALTFALVLWYGVRHLDCHGADLTPRAIRRFWFTLGFLLALVTLTRIDSGLLALLVGVTTLLGLIRPNGPPRLGLNLTAAAWLAFPGAVLVGGLLLFSYVYFGSALPISGLVKMSIEKDAPVLHGGPWGSVLWHLRFLVDWTLDPLSNQVSACAFRTWGVAWNPNSLRAGLHVLLLVGVLVLVFRCVRQLVRRHIQWSTTIYVFVLVLFVLLHLGAYAIMFSRFTQYGTWYFAPEMLLLWALHATAFSALLGAPRRATEPVRTRTTGATLRSLAVGAATVGVLALNARQMCNVDWVSPWPRSFYRTAHWLEHNLPAGQRIAAFSSGAFAYFARSHQVINLDGLMNNRRYLEEYLVPGRIHEYVRMRGVTHLADYHSAAGWRSGAYWGIDLTGMELVYWTPRGDEFSHAVWRIPSDDEVPEPLGPCSYCNRPSQIQYAAEILGQWRVVPEGQLAAWREEPHAARESIVTSIVNPDTLELRHVVVPNADRPSLAINAANTGHFTDVDVTVGRTVRLTGLDLPIRIAHPGERIIASFRWSRLGEAPTTANPEFELALSAADAGHSGVQTGQVILSWHACHNTYPVGTWGPSETVVETNSIQLPSNLRTGRYRLLLAARDPDGTRLPAQPAHLSAASPAFLLSEITIR